MIAGLLALLLCQLVGETVSTVLHLPVPGPVLGMLVLLGWLGWRRPPQDAPVVRAGEGLLRHLQLLFVPAGVGVVAQLALLRDALPAAVGGIALSWLVGLAVTGWTAVLLLRVTGRHTADGTRTEGETAS